MHIARIELREIRLALLHPFETSLGRTTERRIILVRVIDKDGAEGWGECTVDENPHYSEEWVDGAWLMMIRYLAPLIAGKEIPHASDVDLLMSHIRGNRMAKGAIETACWELEARRRGVPLWELLGGRHREIACGVSIGLQPSLPALFEKIAREIAGGYRRIKIKIKPGHDRELVEEVRKRFPEIPLMVDANSAYRLGDATLLEHLDRFELMMIEQPLAHDDLRDHALLQKRLRTPICLDESIRSDGDARLAIDLKACGVVNIKLGRVGGHRQAQRVEAVCRDSAIPVWCGGMLEAGIGRAHNIAMSTLPGFVLPGDVSASARYWAEDIIDPPVTVSPRGTITPSLSPGIGVTVKRDLIESLTTRRETIDGNS